MNDLVVADPTQNRAVTVGWSDDQRKLMDQTIFRGFTQPEAAFCLYQAQRLGLDPLARQIHFIKRKSKHGDETISIQTAIDGYRLISDRTGKYAGSDDYRFDEGLTEYEHIKSGRGKPETATVTVYKLIGIERCPFTATARWSEYFPGEKQGFMWEKMPYLMIGKCAEALALRKAFPAELGGVYIDEEMAQAGGIISEGNGVIEDQRKRKADFKPGSMYEGTLVSYDAPGQKQPQKLVVDVDGAELTIGGFKLPEPWTAQTMKQAIGKRVQVSYSLKDNKFSNLTHFALAPEKEGPSFEDLAGMLEKASAGDLEDLWRTVEKGTWEARDRTALKAIYEERKAHLSA